MPIEGFMWSVFKLALILINLHVEKFYSLYM